MPPIHRGIDSYASNAQDGPSDHLSIRGRGCHHHGCPGPKYANASGSRRRMTPLSRSDLVLRFCPFTPKICSSLPCAAKRRATPLLEVALTQLNSTHTAGEI